MFNSWFSSRSSRHRKTPSSPPPTTESAKSDVSSVSLPTAGPSQTPANLTSVSDVPPSDEAHGHVNDPSVYAPTPSIIHSTEKHAGTLDTPDAPAGLEATPSARITQVSTPEKTLFTPQDAIIAKVFGKSAHPAEPVHGTPSPPSNVPQPSVSLRTSDSVPTPVSIQTPRARPGPTLTIYDPFSGIKLGENTPMSPSTATPGEPSTPTPLPIADDRRLWSSLERILELQAEIAAMHADMEGVGKSSVNNPGGMTSMGGGESGSASSRKRRRRGQTLPVGDEEPEEHGLESGVTGVTVSELSTDHSDGEDEDEDDEDDEDSLHLYGKRRRDEEFTRLAEQFAQRKVAINGIMNKLDALSTALKTFHTLPPPLFDLALSPSCTDTMSSAQLSDLAASGASPIHVYPDQPLSSLSSVSSSQAGYPVSSPVASVSPLLPHIPTLAPHVSSGVRKELAPLVTPALPRMVLPTIIPGAPHVESPADMDHGQSVFQRAQ